MKKSDVMMNVKNEKRTKGECQNRTLDAVCFDAKKLCPFLLVCKYFILQAKLDCKSNTTYYLPNLPESCPIKDSTFFNWSSPNPSLDKSKFPPSKEETMSA